MREILFRGKGTSGLSANEWVYGYYCKDFWTPRKGHGILPTDKERGGYVEVDPSTVGQYTGLTDKNGKRIFEGDIVSTDITRPYLIVEFRDGCFMFNCNDGGKDYYDIMLPILEKAQTEYKYGEVIGNIHDNPEFMKEGADNG